MQRDPAFPPDPEGGWSQSVRTFQDAFVVPPPRTGKTLETGVFSKDRDLIARAAMWRREALVTLPPPFPGDVTDRLEGRWLWGGVAYNHFGHFLVESLSRLWAVEDAHDGILFVPRDPAKPQLSGYQADLVQQIAGDCPVVMVDRPLQVAHLDVPGPGFGLGRIAKGTKMFRAHVAAHFGRDIAPEGPEDLFISRARLGTAQGGFVGEDLLDRRMEDAGYTVFHPETAGIGEQIARYKAARRIVALDGSALHLVAMVARKDQDVAVILRRESGKSSSLRRQLEFFAGRMAHIVQGLDDSGKAETVGKKRRISDLNFEQIGQGLYAGGFLEAPWGALSESEQRHVAEAWQKSVSKPFDL